MNKRSWLFFIPIFFFLSGCMFSNPLPRLWFYTYSGSASSDDGDSLLTPASFLELKPDGNYTRDFGQFEYGTWTRKDQALTLTSHEHTITNLTLGPVTIKEMQLTLPGGAVGHFDGFTLPSSDKESADPFSVVNNRWRIRATHKESDAEIRHRLYNHCQFWAAYFNWALDNSLSTVDVRSTPTVIKIYGNGFGLKPFEDLPSAWRKCFFDDADCQRASEVVGNIFQHKSIAWAHTDNKYKMFLSAFQQMQNFLR